MRVFDSGGLRKTFGPEREKVARYQRTLHYEERHDVHYEERRDVHYEELHDVHYEGLHDVHYEELHDVHYEERHDVHYEERHDVHYEERHDVHSSPNIIRRFKSRRMRWAIHVARMGKRRGACGILVGKSEGKT